MDGLHESQIARLQSDVQKGQLVRDFCRHGGFKLYQEALMSIIEDRKQTWLKGDDASAREARIQAQGVQKALDVLKQFMLIGENSARILNNDVPAIDEK